jgi:general transcription factor 3C polypeptide 3 (transcription factor C subunit 4)
LKRISQSRKDDGFARIVVGSTKLVKLYNTNSSINHFSKAQQILGDKNPRLYFCLGVSHLNRLSTKKNTNRSSTLLKSFTFFFNYYNLSNKSQEASFNLARAFHQVGFFYLAVPFYEQVIEMGKEIREKEEIEMKDEEEKEIFEIGSSSNPKHYNLDQEANFNLHLIYKNSGNNELANECIENIIL